MREIVYVVLLLLAQVQSSIPLLWHRKVHNVLSQLQQACLNTSPQRYKHCQMKMNNIVACVEVLLLALAAARVVEGNSDSTHAEAMLPPLLTEQALQDMLSPPEEASALASDVTKASGVHAKAAHDAAVAAQATTAEATTATVNAASTRRKLLEQPPTLCGKLGTYIPNVDNATDKSMFGFSISSSLNGSIIATGAPMNVDDATKPGAAMVLRSMDSKTCEYQNTPVWQPAGSYRYFGAQVALSEDGNTLAVMDGVEGVKTATAQGNRPVVHVYKRLTTGEYRYLQKLGCAARKAMASSMALSITAKGELILVSFSVAEGYTDKIGSAQVFVLNGTTSTAKYAYLQDLASLNTPAGSSVQFGSSSVISSNGMTIAVASAAAGDMWSKYTYMYRRDTATGSFRITSSIAHGEFYGDTWSTGRKVGLTDDSAVAMSQTGRFVLRVENAMLVVYEWSGTGMSMTWQRRCKLTAPDGYQFRTTGDALSIMEVSSSRTKFAAGAYTGALDDQPEQMAVFLYHLNTAKASSCPFRAAERHLHNDPYSNYGASVTVTGDGNLLIVGAPMAWDNNMQKQYGAVYVIDISTVADEGLEAMTVTAATNTNAGCVNGVDANGNRCVNKEAGTVICRDVKKSDGSLVHYGPIGCTPTPAPPSFWTTTISDSGYATVKSETLSAYTTMASSTKGSVGVPVATTSWLANQATAASTNSYYGYPVALTSAKTSVVPTSGWPVSTAAAFGGLASSTAVGSTTVGAASTSGTTLRAITSLLSGLGSWLRTAVRAGSAGVGTVGSVGTATGIGTTAGSMGTSSGTISGLPVGAVITNPQVLTG